MKLCLPVVLAALVATLLHSTEYAAGTITCPQENCVEVDKCEESIRGDSMCPTSTDICCSVVKMEFRTHCSHHGGECMDTCNHSLQQSVTDCPANQVCCVLV